MAPEPLDDAGLAEAAWSARADWRADELEWLTAAYEQWSHGRTLADRAREHLHRGDTIALTTPSCATPVVGAVVGVGPDLLALYTAGGRVDVRLDPAARVAWRVVHRAASGGGRGLVVDGFRARLLELEAEGGAVDAAAPVADGVVRGRLTVGRDHVVLEDDGAMTVVGIGALEWVRGGGAAPTA